jgi:hypothetical protein
VQSLHEPLMLFSSLEQKEGSRIGREVRDNEGEFRGWGS